MAGGLLAACGSSASSSSAPSTATGASRGTAAPINVGLIGTFSGAGGIGAYDAAGRDMYEAWADTVNAHGGIDGHRVNIIVENDGGVPGTAVTDAEKLVADHVVAAADMSIVDQSFASVFQKAGIPVVGIENNNAPFGTNPDFYPEGQTQDSAVQAVLQTAKSAGATNLGNVYCAESPICAESVPAFTALGKTVGLPVTYDAEISATAPNYTAQCEAAKQQHVTSLFIGDASAVIVRLAQNCAQQGYHPIVVIEGNGYSTSVATASGLRNHLRVEFTALPMFANTAPVKAADAALQRHFPGVLTNTTLFNQLDFMAWASGQLLSSAVNAGGLTKSATPTAAKITKGLDSLHGNTLGGLTVPLTFVAGKPHTVNCWFTAQVHGGVPSLVDNGHVSCAATKAS